MAFVNSVVSRMIAWSRHIALKALVKAGLGASCIAAGMAYADDYSDVNRMLKAGQIAEANAKVDQLLTTKPRDAQMRFLKGVILIELRKTDDAISAFAKLTEDFPELLEPYNNLAVLYAGQNHFGKARAALEMAIRANPDYATAHENLGDVHAKLASQAYSKALQLDSTNTGVQPKLSLIRNLLAASGAKGVHPVADDAAAPDPAAGVEAKSTVKPTTSVAAIQE